MLTNSSWTFSSWTFSSWALRSVVGLAFLSLLACGEQEATTQTPEDITATDEATPEVSPSEAFIAMADDHAQQVLYESPEFATFLGVDEAMAGEDYNARLGSYGFASNQRSRALNETFHAGNKRR